MRKSVLLNGQMRVHRGSKSVLNLVNPRPCAAFYSVERPALTALGPLMELELRGKNERVVLNERKPMISNLKVSGQLMTSEVRSNTRSGPLDTTIFVIP